MISRRLLAPISVLLLLIATPRPAAAWDAVGHMIVCQIAYDHLTPTAKVKADAAIARFNQTEKAAYTPVIAGTWMDDIRGQTREYNPWHYVNLPYTRDGQPFPPADEINVLWGINKCLAILDGKGTHPDVDADRAFVILTHLVGDVHQPLHTTSREGDLGGNKVVVPNLIDPELEIFGANGNLHWFWDTAYRKTVDANGDVVALYAGPLYSRSAPVAGHKRSLALVREKADELIAKHPPTTADDPLTPEEWVTESHVIGFDTAYATLPGGDASNPVELTTEYVEAARAIAEKRLTLAGYRLAKLLNDRWK